MLYSSSGTVNSNHTAMIHDLKFDYYAKKYATCASDGFVHIFDAVENTKISSFKMYNFYNLHFQIGESCLVHRLGSPKIW